MRDDAVCGDLFGAGVAGFGGGGRVVAVDDAVEEEAGLADP
jgi:hypothetical protein